MVHTWSDAGALPRHSKTYISRASLYSKFHCTSFQALVNITRMKETLCYSSSNIGKSLGMSGGNAARLSITVLGGSSVGKTALTVQYLTGRFIGDYFSGRDMTYRTSVPHFGGSLSTPVDILDASNSAHYERQDFEKDHLSCWVSTAFAQNFINSSSKIKKSSHHHQAYLVVYSLTDADTFDLAKEILQILPSTAPKFLAANQLDLQHRRQVSFEEGQALADRFGRCHFGEFSAADPSDPLNNQQSIKSAFRKLIRQLISSSPQCILAPYCPRISFSVFSKILSTLTVVKTRSKLRRMTLLVHKPSSEITNGTMSFTGMNGSAEISTSSSCSSIASSTPQCDVNNPASSTSSLISSDVLPPRKINPTISLVMKEHQAMLSIPILHNQHHRSLSKNATNDATFCYPKNLTVSSI